MSSWDTSIDLAHRYNSKNMELQKIGCWQVNKKINNKFFVFPPIWKNKDSNLNLSVVFCILHCLFKIFKTNNGFANSTVVPI